MAKILIVDDSRTSRRILRDLIEKSGNTVAGEAVNGREGVDMYMRLRPDVVTLDITMPVMDGVTALSEILEYDSDARVVMVSAVGQRNKIVDCIRIGARDYIIKPFEVSKVQEILIKIAASSVVDGADPMEGSPADITQ